MLRGLPFERADELIHFERHNRDEGQLTLAVTPHDYVAWRAAQTSFVDLGAYTDVLAIVGGEDVAAESHLAIRINAVSFDLLGVDAAMGRLFHPDDEQPGAPAVILIGDAYWRTRMGADPEVLGKTIRVDGVPTTIVGVMPAYFGFPVDEQLWLPLQLDLAGTSRGAGRLDAFGRLLPGRTIVAARGEFDVISRNLQEAYPDTNSGIAASLQTFQQEYIGEDFARMMLTMLAGAFLVLGIACANVANLLTARATRRRGEIAVRAAIGGGSGRIFAQLITETTLLATIGGFAGLGIAYAGVAAFRAAWARGVPVGLPHGLSNGLFWWQFEIDAGVLAFVAGLTLLTSIISGVAPALGAVGHSPWGALPSARRFREQERWSLEPRPGDRPVRAYRRAPGHRRPDGQERVQDLDSGRWASCRAGVHGARAASGRGRRAPRQLPRQRFAATLLGRAPRPGRRRHLGNRSRIGNFTSHGAGRPRRGERAGSGAHHPDRTPRGDRLAGILRRLRRGARRGSPVRRHRSFRRRARRHRQ